MSDEARRTELMARIIELEPQMLRVLGPAQARDWVDVDLTMSQLKMMFVLSGAMGPGDGSSGLRVGEVARGLQWADWHNGRSGRTARQFIDHLAGELGVASRAEG